MAGREGVYVKIGGENTEAIRSMDEVADKAKDTADKVEGSFQGYAPTAEAAKSALDGLKTKIGEVGDAAAETGGKAATAGASIGSMIGSLAGGAIAAAAIAAAKAIGSALREAEERARATEKELARVRAHVEAIGISSRTAAAGKMYRGQGVLAEYDAAQEGLRSVQTGANPSGAGTAEAERWDKAAAALSKYAETNSIAVSGVRDYVQLLEAEYRGLSEVSDMQAALRVEKQKAAQEDMANHALSKIRADEAAAATKKRLAEELAAIQILKSSWDKGEFPDLGDDSAKRAESIYRALVAEEKRVQALLDRADQTIRTNVAKGNQAGEMPDLDKSGKKIGGVKNGLNDLAAAGQAVGDAFGAIGSAIGGATGNIIAQVGAVVALTVKFIGLAIAASMASAGQTPIVGPWAAIAGGVAVAAAVIGLIAGIASPRAEGGPVSGYSPYLVGERGPELFVPGSSGSIVPNHQLGASGGVTVNITAADAGSFESMLRRNDSALVRVLRQASRNGRA